MKVTIEVTQDDIDEGKPGAACACAVFLAARHALPMLRSIGSASFWFFSSDMEIVSVRQPEPVRELIRQLDHGQPVAPFDFELDVPAGVLAAGAS